MATQPVSSRPVSSQPVSTSAVGSAAVSAAAASARFRRGRRSELLIWWREIDRVLLALVLTLMAIGSVAVLAASPASARRLSTTSVKIDDLHFFVLHLRWQFLGLLAMFGA